MTETIQAESLHSRDKKRARKIFLFLVLFFLVGLAVFGIGYYLITTGIPANAIAGVGDKYITTQDVIDFEDALKGGVKDEAALAKISQKEKDKALGNLIERVLLDQEAKSKNITVNEQDLIKEAKEMNNNFSKLSADQRKEILVNSRYEILKRSVAEKVVAWSSGKFVLIRYDLHFSPEPTLLPVEKRKELTKTDKEYAKQLSERIYGDLVSNKITFDQDGLKSDLSGVSVTIKNNSSSTAAYDGSCDLTENGTVVYSGGRGTRVCNKAGVLSVKLDGSSALTCFPKGVSRTTGNDGWARHQYTENGVDHYWFDETGEHNRIAFAPCHCNYSVNLNNISYPSGYEFDYLAVKTNLSGNHKDGTTYDYTNYVATSLPYNIPSEWNNDTNLNLYFKIHIKTNTQPTANFVSPNASEAYTTGAPGGSVKIDLKGKASDVDDDKVAVQIAWRPVGGTWHTFGSNVEHHGPGNSVTQPDNYTDVSQWGWLPTNADRAEVDEAQPQEHSFSIWPTAGNYEWTVRARDEHDAFSDWLSPRTFTVADPIALSCSLTPPAGVAPLVVQVKVNGGSAPYDFDTNNDGTYEINDRNGSIFYTFQSSGFKTILVMDSAGKSTSCSITVKPPSGSRGGEVAP